MKARLVTLIAFAALSGGLALHPLAAQDESPEDLVRKLKGQASQTTGGVTARGGITSRGGTRSIGGAAAPAVKTETRSVVLSRGVPKAVSAAAEEDKVTIQQSPAGQQTLNYTVDSESKVSRDNIFFRKGSADFADDASVNVVVTLATALKHPELKGLQFVIEGHASAEGDAVSNQFLSQLRAEQIVSVLTSLGVDNQCLIPVGFGESQARFPDSSPEQLLKQDRRVLIFRLDRK